MPAVQRTAPFAALPTLACLLLLVCWSVSPATATYSPVIGSTTAGTFGQIMSCRDGYSLIGFEVKYGPTGVGKIRGVCRAISASSSWTGSSAMTGWSRVNSEAESTQTQSIICPQGKVVASVEASLSGPNFHRLRVGCKSINSAGHVTGSQSPTAWAGVSAGQSSGWKNCPDGMAANGTNTRSKTLLHMLRLSCGYADVEPQARDYILTGSEILRAYDLAVPKGFRFTCGKLPRGCRVERAGGQIRLTMPQVEAGNPVMSAGLLSRGARFFLFDRGSLKPGWSFKTVEIRTQSMCLSPDQNGPFSSSPKVLVDITCKNPGYYGWIHKIVIHGPSDPSGSPGNNYWENAF